jgi:hypothetical protein
MVYAAIAAAAFSQESWVYADLLCAASLLALGYAVMLIIYARGAHQAAATGFAVFTLLLAVCMLVAPNSVPTQRIVMASGVGQSVSYPTPIPAQPPMATGTLSLSTTYAAPPLFPTAGNSYSTWSPSQPAQVFVAATPTLSYYDITFKLRAANAVATMICGLLGALVALVAYRRTRTSASLEGRS